MADSTTTNSMPAWYQQAAQNYLGQAGRVAGQPYQNYQRQRVANLNPLTTQGMQGYQGLLGANPYNNAASYLNSAIDGSSNPFNQDVVNRTTRQATQGYNDATRRTTAMFNRPGSRNFGSSAHMQGLDRNDENLARGLGDALGSLNYQGYESNQNRRMQAANAMPGMVGAQSNLYNQAMGAGMMGQNQQQQLLDSQYQDWQAQQNWGQRGLDIYGNALRSAQGGAPQTTTTSTQDQKPDRTSQWLGAGALGLGLLYNGR